MESFKTSDGLQLRYVIDDYPIRGARAKANGQVLLYASKKGLSRQRLERIAHTPVIAT